MSWNSAATTDIFVVGGGPAGLAAAIAARQKGFRVVLADGSEPPIDKACGEGLLPDGLAALKRLGIRVPASEGRALCGIRFLTGDRSAQAVFPQHSYGLALRRTVLHRLMAERAEQLGVELLWRTVVTGISSQGVHLRTRLDPRQMSARWIVGANGFNSQLRRWVGIANFSRPRLRFAFRRHYRVAPWTDHMEVYWGEHCQGYAVAIDGERVCVAVASHDPKLRSEDGLRTLPQLRSRLHRAEVISTERGALTGNRKLLRVWRGNVALIGDAAGTVDAITGEGLGLAFSQAVALADCFESGSLAHYQTEHRKLMRRLLWMSRLMLTLDGRSKLQHRTLQVFERHPEIFRRLIAMHVGALPPTHLVRDGFALGWGLLTA
jgi:menaquinone-9 beta-reductase